MWFGLQSEHFQVLLFSPFLEIDPNKTRKSPSLNLSLCVQQPRSGKVREAVSTRQVMGGGARGHLRWYLKGCVVHHITPALLLLLPHKVLEGHQERQSAYWGHNV